MLRPGPSHYTRGVTPRVDSIFCDGGIFSRARTYDAAGITPHKDGPSRRISADPSLTTRKRSFHMAKRDTATRSPLSASDIQDRVDLARRLIALAAEQQRQAALNTDLARVGLAELITDLESQGVRS